jgi:hypothetical protein
MRYASMGERLSAETQGSECRVKDRIAKPIAFRKFSAECLHHSRGGISELPRVFYGTVTAMASRATPLL